MRLRVVTFLRIALQVAIAVAPGGLLVLGAYHLHRRFRKARRRRAPSP